MLTVSCHVTDKKSQYNRICLDILSCKRRHLSIQFTSNLSTRNQKALVANFHYRFTEWFGIIIITFQIKFWMDYVSNHGVFLVFWMLYLKLLVATGNSSLWLPSRCCLVFNRRSRYLLHQRTFSKLQIEHFRWKSSSFHKHLSVVIFSEDKEIERVPNALEFCRSDHWF